MWISRDKHVEYDDQSNDVIFYDKKPTVDTHGTYGGSYIFMLDIDEFKKAFPKVKLPRKGSCREIKGLKIIEKGE